MLSAICTGCELLDHLLSILMRLYDTVYNIPYWPVLFRSLFKESLALSHFAIALNQIWVYNTVFGKIV